MSLPYCKSCCTENCRRMLRTLQHLHNDTHTSHTQAPTAPCVTIQTENIHHNHLHKHTTYFNTPKLKHYLTKMRHIHTSIVSRHLATRGNNKILHTPPPHIISSEEILPHLTRHTLAQFRTNKSPYLRSRRQNTSSLQLHPHMHHFATPGVVDKPRWRTISGNHIHSPTPHTSKGHGNGQTTVHLLTCFSIRLC